jgi:sec-independent protein translocase protein TatC
VSATSTPVSATSTGAARRGAMPLLAHLLELRRRLVRSALAIALGAVAGWLLSGAVLDAVRGPITAVAREQHRLASLNFDSVTGAFDLRFGIAVTTGVVLASPVWLYQVWAFFVPALTRRERRVTVAFLGSAIPLFLAGCAAGWAVVPHMIALLTGFAGAGDTTILQAPQYVAFLLKLVLAVGAAFVAPVLVVLLNAVGLVSAASVARSWRIAVLGIVIFTALVTPAADLLSMGLLALPMLLLFAVTVGVTQLHDRRAVRGARPAAQLEEV